jgi:threonine/homoserine/homoserine lactone efflux protein
MIPMANLLAFSLTALVIVLLPGPNVLFTIGRALALGRRAALLTIVGTATGMYLQVILVSLGLGVLLEQSIVLMTVVKFVGAGFLVYLGIQAIRHRNDAARELGEVKPIGAFRTIVEGLIVGVTNPKTIVFFLAILPQFVVHGASPIGLQMLLLGAIFIAIGVVFDSVYAFAAGAARTWFGKSPKRLSGLGVAGGVAMIGLGVGLAATGAVEGPSSR